MTLENFRPIVSNSVNIRKFFLYKFPSQFHLFIFFFSCLILSSKMMLKRTLHFFRTQRNKFILLFFFYLTSLTFSHYFGQVKLLINLFGLLCFSQKLIYFNRVLFCLLAYLRNRALIRNYVLFLFLLQSLENFHALFSLFSSFLLVVLQVLRLLFQSLSYHLLLLFKLFS